MKVVVVYKWARDEASATVRSGGQVDWGAAKFVAGDDDHAALATAKAIAEASGGEVVGLTLGNGEASWVLARGVEKAFSVDAVPPLADNAVTAAILAAATQAIGQVDVVVIGDSDQATGVGVTLAGHLGWPVIAGVSSAGANDDQVTATRRGAEVTQTLATPAPVVLVVAAAGSEPRAPGMREQLLARKRPIERLDLAGFDLDLEEGFTLAGTSAPTNAGASMIEGSIEQQVPALLSQLQAEGVM
ncbi:MAG: hypothetical protein FWG16_02690 [Micrococcales bacterium]|nr:hypothetical protein [Micrococcales bacterium]